MNEIIGQDKQIINDTSFDGDNWCMCADKTKFSIKASIELYDNRKKEVIKHIETRYICSHCRKLLRIDLS